MLKPLCGNPGFTVTSSEPAVINGMTSLSRSLPLLDGCLPSSIGPVTVTMQEAMEAAERRIDKVLQKERLSPDRRDFLGVTAHNCPTLSGMAVKDYPLEVPDLITAPNLSEIRGLYRAPLPPQLLEQLEDMQSYCMMGLFPHLSLAWLTVDHKIFIWDYKDHESIIDYFHDQSETIIAVGLANSQKVMFHPHTPYLLVLTTPVEIILLGLSFVCLKPGYDRSMSAGVQILQDPLYRISTDNICLRTIMTADTGRIFLAGKDGFLYEASYHDGDSWLGLQCRKINHTKSAYSLLVSPVPPYAVSENDPIVQIAVDNSRNILYTHSEKGVLQVYDLGHNGDRMNRVTSVCQNSIVSAAGNIAQTIDQSHFKPIVHIAVIETSESVTCHLLAVTHTGVQMYFSTVPFGQRTARPSTLSLVYVLMPEGLSASSIMERPRQVYKARNGSNGVLIMAASEDEENILWCVSHDAFPVYKPLMETQQLFLVYGNEDITPVTDPPVVFQQHLVPSNKFVSLSAEGSHIFYRLRPVDQLRRLLCDGVDEKAIECFFKMHNEDQACATCLMIACSAASDGQTSARATWAFFKYGGKAQMCIHPSLLASSIVEPSFDSPMPVGLPVPAGSPVPNPRFSGAPAHSIYPTNISLQLYSEEAPAQQPLAPLPGSPRPEIVFSAKHDGICLFLSYIVGHFWDGSLVVEKTFKTGQKDVTAIDNCVSLEVLESVLQELKGLLGFLDSNPQLTASPVRPPGKIRPSFFDPSRYVFDTRDPRQELQLDYNAEAQRAEITSLQGIQLLVKRMCQILVLWKLLCEHQFQHIVSRLQKEQQEQLKIATFKDLAIRDTDLARALIASLVKGYILSNKTVDGISSHLQDVCPSFYTSDDAIYAKASQLVQRSRKPQNRSEKLQMLRESLREYQKISHQLDLADVCGQYGQVGFYEGVVELCLAAVEKKDPRELGLQFHKNGEPAEDSAGLQAYQYRLNSYKCITDALQELVNQSRAAPQSPDMPKKTDPLMLSSDPGEKARLHIRQILRLARHSKDELFKLVLSKWLLQDYTDSQLKLNSLSMEPRLVHTPELEKITVDYVELLRRCHKKKQNDSSNAGAETRLAASRKGPSSPHFTWRQFLAVKSSCSQWTRLLTSQIRTVTNFLRETFTRSPSATIV